MKGTPFSLACRAECTAGQVVSRMAMVPERTASEKRGAGPASPRLTAAASMTFTQPAPISRSAARPPMGTANR